MIIGHDQFGNDIDIHVKQIATTGSAIIAMRGAGKSWLNAVIAEGLAKSRIPFALIDPEGEYWTIKIKYPNIVIAGGEHADIPLKEEIAEMMARIALEDRLELIIDLSDMRRTQQIKFIEIFLNELFHKETEYRIPFWVSLEEADLWVPQKGNPSCKIPVLDVCQRGRKRGIGFALVSQRPAVLDKTALSQAEFRFFKRFQQPHDLRSVSDYLGSHSDRIKLLPSLSVDEALFYAPTISKNPIQMKVARRISPHGGATPAQIALIKPTTTILELRKKLESYIIQNQREKSIIQELKQRINQLEVRLEEKEEELEKIQLASDVANLLIESRAHLLDTKNQFEKHVNLMKKKEPETFLHNDDSLEFLGRLSINIHTGMIIGSDLANLLLNRLNPDERILYLALKRTTTPNSIKEISRATGFGETKTRRIIHQLKRKELVKVVGRQKHRRLYTLHLEAISEVT